MFILIMEKQPAPRPMETNNLLSSEYIPLEEDGLIEGLGVIPGATEIERIKLEEDNLISGRGCVP